MSTEENNQELKDKDLLVSAFVSSSVIVVGFVVYWAVQIKDVIELLKLAYGL